MKVKGPVVTLGAVAALGIAIWLVNINNESEPAEYAKPVASPPAATAPAPAPSATSTPPAQFPAKADYVGKIPLGSGVITLDITVNGVSGIAYACDGNTVEAWLRGNVESGSVRLASKDNTSRLEGSLKGNQVAGTLWINQKHWEFATGPAQPPAGLYVYQQGGVRNSWIIDQDNGVTGVQRKPDGSTAPAPKLSIDGTVVIDGQTITATRVESDSDVS